MARYDTESGLVYNEYTMTAEPPCRCAERKKKRRSDALKSLPIAGRSLREMALRRVLQNLDRLDDESLSTLPVPLLEEIWKFIFRSGLTDLRIWRLFAQTPLALRTFVYSHILCPHCSPLPSLFGDHGSSSPIWLTNLTLQSVASPEYLAQVATLPGILNISILGDTDASAFTDRTLHSWADEAAKGCFNKLEMIFVDGQNEITTNALRYLNAFPALDTFGVHRTGISDRKDAGRIARKLGWSRRQDGYFMQFAQEQYRAGWNTMVSAYIIHRRGLVSREHDDHPVLNLSVGRFPKRQTQIRTWEGIICFEREDEQDVASDAPNLTGGSNETERSEPSSKKRKVKEGKAVDLGDMLRDM
jgi:hypothetical protein